MISAYEVDHNLKSCLCYLSKSPTFYLYNENMKKQWFMLIATSEETVKGKSNLNVYTINKQSKDNTEVKVKMNTFLNIVKVHLKWTPYQFQSVRKRRCPNIPPPDAPTDFSLYKI